MYYVYYMYIHAMFNENQFFLDYVGGHVWDHGRELFFDSE